MIHSFATLFAGEIQLQLRQALSVLLLLGLPVALAATTVLGTSALSDTEAAREVGEATGLGGKEQKPETADSEVERYRVWAPPDWRPRLEGYPHLELVDAAEDAAAELRHLRKGDDLRVFYDLDFPSIEAGGALEDAVEAELERERSDKLEATGIPPSHELLEIDLHDRATDAHRAGATIGTLLPSLMMFALMIAGLLTALDVFTGEKERGTIETLLTTRADRRAVAAAKLAVVVGATALTGWIFLGALVGLQRIAPSDPVGWPLSLAQLIGLCGITLLLAPQVGGITSILGIYADDYKTGSMLSAPVMLLLMVPAGAPFLPVELDMLTAAIPIANASLAARELLGGELGPGMGAAVIGFSAVHVMVAGWAVWRLLDRETALIGSGAMASTGERRRGGQALAVAAVGFSALWFFAAPAQMIDIVGGVVFGQALFVAVAFGAIAWLGLPARKTMSLRLPDLRTLLFAVLAGVAAPSFGTLVFQLQSLVAPAPAELFDALGALELADQPLWVPLLCFALLPAVCEELLFRGAILGLQRSGSTALVVVIGNAVLFGLFHIHFHRWLPTGALGLLTATAVWRSRSLLPAIVIHFANNAIAIAAERSGAEATEASPLDLVLACMGTAVAWYAVSRMRATDQPSTAQA